MKVKVKVVVISILRTFLISFHPLVTFTFSKYEFGKTKHVKLCQHSWFGKWNSSIDNEDKDSKLCHICVSALKQKKVQTRRCDPS